MHVFSLAGSWKFRQTGTEEWLPAQVPGCVHIDLTLAPALSRDPGARPLLAVEGFSGLRDPGHSGASASVANGRIPDPFVADNEKRVQWVAESDWEYERIVSVDAELLSEERVMLVCDGLDTLAEVRLNGQPVGKA